MPFARQEDSAGDEVFAAYGRAMHSAQALEHWLRILVTVTRAENKTFASQYEIERAVNTLSTSTMGTVVAALRLLVDDPELEAKLTHAVAERNRLAHQFFGHWADVWDEWETEALMIQDANRVQTLFVETVRDLSSILGASLDSIGSNPDEFIPGLSERVQKILKENGAPRE